MQESRKYYHEEEPVLKMIKLEVEELEDLLDEAKDESADDEIPTLPLTFSTPADLMWKLQKAEIIPTRPVFCNLGKQRSRSRDFLEGHSMEQERTDMREEVVVYGDTVERHSFDEENRIIRDREGVMRSGGVFDKTVEVIKEEVITDEVDVVVEMEDDVMEENDRSAIEEKTVFSMFDNNSSSRPLGRVKLLNKPPRLGLSKLYKSSTSLHDISIVEKGVKNVNHQRKLFLSEKEE